MKEIIVCVDLREDSLATLAKLKNKIDTANSRIHLIHVFEIKAGIMEFAAIMYPTPDQYPVIKSSVLAILDNLQHDLGLSDEQVVKNCFFAPSKEKALKDYLDEKHATLAVVATRGKHGIEGLFSSSLADYLSKYSPCDLLVLRP